ncbi:hypothetical protein AKJ09_09318 [Labilithrix luteola]|uniref:Uncharacterized protein n=1 Tax=Labilithrix luteola TaxID=1391654 RepID=A0A0K1QB67_9BACT|nr:hypothetical protein AKJ09_09318 [Labilithrix luteola]
MGDLRLTAFGVHAYRRRAPIELTATPRALPSVPPSRNLERMGFASGKPPETLGVPSLGIEVIAFEVGIELAEAAREIPAARFACHEEVFEVLEEPAVVRGDDNAAGPPSERLTQPTDALVVEIVGRLVEEQDLRTRGERRGQRAPSALTVAANGHSGGGKDLRNEVHTAARMHASSMKIHRAGENVEQRRLANAVASDERHAFPR